MSSAQDQRGAAASVAANQLAGSCVRAIGAPVRSVILHGSLTNDDFMPGHSDIDLLAVVDGRLSATDVRALEAIVRSAGLGDASGIDLHVVTAEVAAAPARSPALELHLGRYPGLALEVEVMVDAAPDLATELSIARATGRALVGATPREVIGAVPPAWIRQRGQHWIRVWQALTHDRTHAQLMVLTACRIWRFGIEGDHSSKTEAGRWALARNGTLTAVAEALRQRAVDPELPIDEVSIARVLETVHRELAASDSEP